MQPTHNHINSAKNLYQGTSKKVLCICSAGILRSPTIAWVLSNPPYNYNTRAVGIVEEYALIPATKLLVEHWAQEIVCAHENQYFELIRKFEFDVPCHILNIPDTFDFRDEQLIKMIAAQYDAADNIANGEKQWTGIGG